MGCSESKNAIVDSEAPTLKNGPEYFSQYDECKGPYAHTDHTGESTLVFAKKGMASKEVLAPTTFPALFADCAKKKADKIALRIERPTPAIAGKGPVPPTLPLDQWKTWTYKQYFDESTAAAKALLKYGFKQHDSVNVFGFNSPEWHMSQNAAMLAGGMVAGIYPTDSSETVQYKSVHSGASVMVLEDEGKFKKVAQHINEIPKLKAIVVWGFTPAEASVSREDGTSCAVLTWEAFVKEGMAEPNDKLEAVQSAIFPTHCCGLIYTSGTTGRPKAVMISHDSVIFEARSVMALVPALGSVAGEGERILSYLPLSHVAGMMVDIVAPICLTLDKKSWTEVWFARPYDLKVGSFKDRLQACRPTMFLGVPRVWEKISEKMKATAAGIKGLKRKVAIWAKGKGLAHQQACQLGGDGSYPMGYGKAEKLVLSKVKQQLGLDACKFGFTGAAPITTDTLEYFGALGIQINELYGMSECTGATTFSTDEAHLWGSCGWAMPGTEVKCFVVDPEDNNKKTEVKAANDIFNATEEEQGEICFRGRHIMMGYMAQPTLGKEHMAEIAKKTADAIDADGWLHSGDKGCISRTGMVKITGRYKELIIGSGGENIAPVPIEDNVKKIRPAISNIMMVGDKRKFNVAIVTLKAKGATGELPGGDDLDGPALLVSPGTSTISGAMKDPVWHKYIESGIVETNAGVTPPSRIQRFTILPADLSVETGELTPTLKLKRSVVEKKWAATVEKLYGEAKGKQTYFEHIPLA